MDHFIMNQWLNETRRRELLGALRGPLGWREAEMEWRVRGPCTPVRPSQREQARGEFLTLDATDDWYLG